MVRWWPRLCSPLERLQRISWLDFLESLDATCFTVRSWHANFLHNESVCRLYLLGSDCNTTFALSPRHPTRSCKWCGLQSHGKHPIVTHVDDSWNLKLQHPTQVVVHDVEGDSYIRASSCESYIKITSTLMPATLEVSWKSIYGLVITRLQLRAVCYSPLLASVGLFARKPEWLRTTMCVERKRRSRRLSTPLCQ